MSPRRVVAHLATGLAVAVFATLWPQACDSEGAAVIGGSVHGNLSGNLRAVTVSIAPEAAMAPAAGP